MELPKKLLRSIENFAKLPGVGEKTAMRQVLFMTKWSKDDLLNFAGSIEELGQLRKCQKCGFFTDDDLCIICRSLNRCQSGILCVVENVTDYLAIEKSGEYRGLYHILGGVLNPLIGVGPDELNIDNLLARVTNENITEVILAINPSVEGDATCSYIKHILPKNVEVDRIGFGIPIGGSLEYLDAMTIAKALENKKRM